MAQAHYRGVSMQLSFFCSPAGLTLGRVLLGRAEWLFGAAQSRIACLFSSLVRRWCHCVNSLFGLSQVAQGWPSCGAWRKKRWNVHPPGNFYKATACQRAFGCVPSVQERGVGI